MSEQVSAAFGRIVGRLVHWALQDDEIRAGVRDLGNALAQLAGEPRPAESASEAIDKRVNIVRKPEPSPIAKLAKAIKPPPGPPIELAPTPPSANGYPASPVTPPPASPRSEPYQAVQRPLEEPPPNRDFAPEGLWSAGSVTDEDLPQIASRCQLKAEAARWGLERRRLMAAEVDFTTEIQPRDRNLIDRAKNLEDCFLWICQPGVGDYATPEEFEQLASCFDAGAKLAEMLLRFSQAGGAPRDLTENVLQLAAEVQSALRASVLKFSDHVDHDQQRLFSWIRGNVERHGIFIRKYMRKDEPANPARAPQLLADMDVFEARTRELKQREKNRREGFKGIKYHLDKARHGKPGESLQHWQRVVDAGAELVNAGVPPSNVELRDLLMPVADEIPEELSVPEAFQRVLREIDRFIASKPKEANESEAETLSADVRQVRELLQGRAMVMIGGERRPWAAESLISKFGLSDLIWIESREHSSYTAFEADVARPDVALVILAIRWSSHGFGEVKNYCDKYGKLLVRLPAGYNPTSVAHQVLKQVGKQLVGNTVAASA